MAWRLACMSGGICVTFFHTCQAVEQEVLSHQWISNQAMDWIYDLPRFRFV